MDILAFGQVSVTLFAILIKISLIPHAKIARSEREEWSAL